MGGQDCNDRRCPILRAGNYQYINNEDIPFTTVFEDDREIVLHFSSPLNIDSHYLLKIQTGLIDLALNKTPTDFQQSFTASGDEIYFDNKAPEVEKILIANGRNIKILFSEEISEFPPAAISLEFNNQTVIGSLSFTPGAPEATFSLVEAATPGTYNLRVSSAVKDETGKPLSDVNRGLIVAVPDQVLFRLEKNIAATSVASNSTTFQGRNVDRSTGLIYFRARYLDSISGRFISQDPLPFADSPNPYSAFKNNYINRNDPIGFVSGPFNPTIPDIPDLCPTCRSEEGVIGTFLHYVIYNHIFFKYPIGVDFERPFVGVTKSGESLSGRMDVYYIPKNEIYEVKNGWWASVAAGEAFNEYIRPRAQASRTVLGTTLKLDKDEVDIPGMDFRMYLKLYQYPSKRGGIFYNVRVRDKEQLRKYIEQSGVLAGSPFVEIVTGAAAAKLAMSAGKIVIELGSEEIPKWIVITGGKEALKQLGKVAIFIPFMFPEEELRDQN